VDEELRGQARLAHTCRAKNCEQVARALLAHGRERVGEQPLLAFASDHRCFVASSELAGHREEPARKDRIGLALELEPRDGLRLDRVADELQRRLADQDFAGLRRLLEAGGNVDGVAGGQALLGPGHDLSRVHADPGLDAELGQSVAHLDRGAARAQRVVLVYLWDAEDGHDRVTDELLHCPAVRLDDPFHPLEVAGEHGAQCLRVCRLAKRGRTGDVAEENCDRLSLLA
jgi:hypothetical protein